MAERTSVLSAIHLYCEDHGCWPLTWDEASRMDSRFGRIEAKIRLISESATVARYRIEIRGVVKTTSISAPKRRR